MPDVILLNKKHKTFCCLPGLFFRFIMIKNFEQNSIDELSKGFSKTEIIKLDR